MFGEALVICEKELRSIRHNPADRLMSLFRPLLFLFVFGSVGATLFKLTGQAARLNYQQFMLPGILVNAVLATAINYGITLKWEYDLGILSRILVAPIDRWAIVLGKALASVVSAFVETAVLLTLALLIKIGFAQNVLGALMSGIVLATFVIGAASLGMMLAIILQSKEAFTGIAGLVIGPSLFASNTLYNLDQMPTWLRLISLSNPVTYAVDFIRRTLVYQVFEPTALLTDFFAVMLFTLTMLIMTSALFQRLSR